VAIGINCALLMVGAEHLAHSALTTLGLSASERYTKLIFAARAWPLDRNMRKAPEQWRAVYNEMMRTLQ
jgi:hypothetical protein